MSRRARFLACALLAAFAFGGSSAHAGAAPRFGALAAEAPTDSLLDDYLRHLADSTDTYFGLSAQRPDTAGLDTALAARLSTHGAGRLGGARGRQALRVAFAPDPGFTRVDGPVYGARAWIGRRSGPGRIALRAGYASGPNEWRGGAGFEKWLRRGDATWMFEAGFGRLTTGMDRDASDLRLAQLRAFLNGADTRSYYLREGVSARLAREHPLWRASATLRSMDDSPMDVAARWNLLSTDLVRSDNLAAAAGRSNEFELEASARLGTLPYYAEASYLTSGNALGSDFEYRRYRGAIAGDVGLRGWLSLVPQLEYGRLTGQLVPQSAFYLGGSRSLRSLRGSSLAGTNAALARLDAILLPDILTLLRIPHPDALPLQIGAFGAIGAVWGRDPYGGPGTTDEPWPEHGDWRPEAGLALLYRPGLPDPNGFVRVSWANALGPYAGGSRITISYSRGVDLVQPPARD